MDDQTVLAVYQDAYARLTERLVRATTLTWMRLGSYDEADVDRWLRQVRPLALAARTSTVSLVDVSTATLSRTRPLGLTVEMADTLASPRNLPVDEVYRRPFISHWSALSNGADWEQARRAGARRAVDLVTTDTQLAARSAMERVVEMHAERWDEIQLTHRPPLTAPEPPPLPEARDVTTPTAPDDRERIARVVERPREVPSVAQDVPPGPEAADTTPEQPAAPEDEARRIVGYRRVLTGRSCVFCAVAATKTYGPHKPMPLHTHCDCGVAPIYADADPGADTNRALLRELQRRGPQYWRSRGFVDNDGRPVDPTDLPESLASVGHVDELGPVLA